MPILLKIAVYCVIAIPFVLVFFAGATRGSNIEEKIFEGEPSATDKKAA